MYQILDRSYTSFEKHSLSQQTPSNNSLNEKLKNHLENSILAEETIKNQNHSLEDDFNKRIESYKRKLNIRNIVAFIFYGRKIYTKILFKYLDRNLKKNGGILDKIIIAECLIKSKSNETEELIFLNNYIAEHTEGYEIIKFDRPSFKKLYTALHGDDLVFKIDDDIVFISNGTFEKMVEEYFKNDHFMLSANVINHHTMSAIHANMNLMVPFYEKPEFNWIKSNDKTLNESNKLANDCIKYKEDWRVKSKCGAIAHESFLNNIYENNFKLDAYDFKLYNFNSHSYNAWRINFILFQGSIVNGINSMYPDDSSDEEILTILIPKKFKKQCFALGSAVVSHFSYWHTQVKYLSKTNIIEKYEKLSIDYLKGF